MSEPDSDVQLILGRRHDNGADYWATRDGRVYVGNPFSTIASLGLLHELGVDADHEAVSGGLTLLVNAVRADGQVRVAPRAPLYPCYTAEAARVLCRFGLTERVAALGIVRFLLEHAHESGGWRCSFTKFGRGPETRWANPGATLYVLDVLRFFPEYRAGSLVVDRAVVSLLDHWETRRPTGPCHWGIGRRFLSVEYPFLRYNLFFYVHVLSFFGRARKDDRFRAALASLETRLDDEARMIVESPHRGLKHLAFCRRGRPSACATRRYQELRDNVAGRSKASRPTD